MKFPTGGDDETEFYQFIHMHAVGYDFPGGFKVRSVGTPPLWYVEDSIGARINMDGLWVCPPRTQDEMQNWMNDTTHDFKSAYELLLRDGRLLPALRRPLSSSAHG